MPPQPSMSVRYRPATHLMLHHDDNIPVTDIHNAVSPDARSGINGPSGGSGLPPRGSKPIIRRAMERRILPAYATAALLDVLIGAAVFAFPYAAEAAGAGTFGTWANGLFSLVYLLVCLGTAKFIRPETASRCTLMGSLALAAGALVMVSGLSRSSIAAAAVLHAVGAAFFYPAVQVWMTEGLSPDAVVRAMAGYSVAWVLGYLMGPVAAGGLLSAFGPEGRADGLRLLFGISTALAVLNGLVFLLDIPPAPRTADAGTGPDEEAEPSEKILTSVRLMWVANVSTFFLTGLIRFLFTELGKAEGLAPVVVGGVTTAMYAAIVPATWALRRLRGWMFSFGWAVAFQALALPAVVFLAATSSVVLYFAAAVLLGILAAFSFYASASYSLLTGRRRAATVTLNEATIGAGAFLSAACGALVADLFGVQRGFWTGLAAVGLSLAGQALIHKVSRPRSSAVRSGTRAGA